MGGGGESAGVDGGIGGQPEAAHATCFALRYAHSHTHNLGGGFWWLCERSFLMCSATGHDNEF